MTSNPTLGPPRPVVILCGFLGAGKTTLLKRVLEDPRGVRYGASAEAALLGPNPAIRRIRAIQADVPREILFGPDLHAPDSGAAQGHEHICGPGCDHPHHHDHSPTAHAAIFETWHWSCDGSPDWDAVRTTLAALPSWLLRAKGIFRVAIDGADRRVVFQVVGKRQSLVVEDGAPPASNQIVCIGPTDSFDSRPLEALLERL